MRTNHTTITKSDNNILILEILFSSRVRAKVLSATFLSPGEPRNANELSQTIGEYYSEFWKELADVCLRGRAKRASKIQSVIALEIGRMLRTL